MKTINILVLFVLVGCGRTYPDKVRTDFVENCVRSGGSVASCTCAIDALQEEYTLEEYLEMEHNTDTTALPKKLERLLLKCKAVE